MRARPVVIIATVAALAVLAAFPGEAAARLGASLSPVPLVFEEGNELNVTNKSDKPIVATLEIEGKGWRLAETELRLAVDETRAVVVTEAGEDDAVLWVRVTPANPVPAMESVAIVLEGRLRHQTWLEANDVRPWLAGFAGFGGLLLLAWFAARRLRHGLAAPARIPGLAATSGPNPVGGPGTLPTRPPTAPRRQSRARLHRRRPHTAG